MKITIFAWRISVALSFLEKCLSLFWQTLVERIHSIQSIKKYVFLYFWLLVFHDGRLLDMNAL